LHYYLTGTRAALVYSGKHSCNRIKQAVELHLTKAGSKAALESSWQLSFIKIRHNLEQWGCTRRPWVGFWFYV